MGLVNYFISFCVCVLFLCGTEISAAEFTVSSYNSGGLSEHYDYQRAAVMQKLMQERYTAEPEEMALNESIQRLALKILFAQDANEKVLAQKEWDQKGYQGIYERITASPKSENSPNASWHKKAEEIITSYNVRPVIIHDESVKELLFAHLADLSGIEGADPATLLLEGRRKMAKRTFAHYLNFDIICLQEADYLDASVFPAAYQVVFSESDHSKNGVAWNADRFDLVQDIGDIQGRAYAVLLRDKESSKTVLVASGHLTGCNPYRVETDKNTGQLDSAKGDAEIQAVVDLFEGQDADIKIIGMDSNVTSLHPRLNIIKEADYRLDYENYIESTCSNPYQVLNTRIDWIALKTGNDAMASIVNIPVQSVGLNSIHTNMSDHKPIAAKIRY